MPAALHWLLPPVDRRPPTRPLSPADGHSPGDLQRWCLDGGLLWVAGDVYLPLDVATSTQARRAALALVVPEGAAVAMAAAVWCRGGPGLPPALPQLRDPRRTRVDVLVRPGCVSATLTPGLRARQTELAGQLPGQVAGGLERLGRLLVTAPAATAVHLARWGDRPEDDDALEWLWDHGVTLRAAGVVMRQMRRTPGVRRVREVLAAVRRGTRRPLTSIPLDGHAHEIELSPRACP